ncbi:hypothetical protein [Streptomyces sp. SID3343]|uniref:hypothetical protein n=1 Tax=Streptomyces sp. SID3343 TaxID=2690260 RepID=UPI0031F7F99E
MGRPEDADLTVVRVHAPYESREGFLERHFHAGSLDFPATELARLRALCATVPTAVGVFLDRAAILTELAAAATTLIADFGADDDLFLDAVFGMHPTAGTLPFDLPSSMTAVEDAREDVPFDTREPLFRCGHPSPRS